MSAGIYIHVPFCGRICPYCDFAVATGSDDDRERFVETLLREIGTYDAGEFAAGADTIYVGGGTPSVLDADQLARVLDAVRELLQPTPDAWISFEANPEDVTEERAAAWRDLGVRTLSLGVQSLRDDRLEFLGRAHDGALATDAYRASRDAGFDVVSIDLMFGASGQAAPEWAEELAAVIDLAPEHISLYQLTYHEGTPFWRWLQSGRREELPDLEQADLYLQAVDALGEAGYHGYEVSNFARGQEFESVHNSKYWAHLPYLGLGPSAHSFDGRRRWWNRPDWREWASALAAGNSPVAASESLTDTQLATEAVMFGFRTAKGLDLGAVRARWGFDLAALNEERFAEWRSDGFIAGEQILRPSPTGMAIADHLAAETRIE